MATILANGTHAVQTKTKFKCCVLIKMLQLKVKKQNYYIACFFFDMEQDNTPVRLYNSYSSWINRGF
jgi:hypothetical protein